MSNFIIDNLILPTDKSNLRAEPVGADPTKYFQGSDFNSLKSALVDTQTFCRGNFRVFDTVDPTTGYITVETFASTPTVSRTKGSLAIARDSGSLYQNTNGATGWQLVGGGNGRWTTALSDTLTGGVLTGWTQRTGVWTASGSGFTVDGGVNESYLSWEVAPLDLLADEWAMQVDLAYTASATGTNDHGFVISGAAGPVGAGTVRAFIRNTGILVGYDVFGAGGGSLTVSAFPTGTTFNTLKVIQTNGKLSFWLNGTLLWVATVNIGTPARVGLWSNPGHSTFKNLKIWTGAAPV